MEWESASNDQLDVALAQLGSLRSASEAQLCVLIGVVDRRQSWMADGARSLVDWVSVRLGVRAETARQLTRVARRLVDLPVLSERFADGSLSLDQVDALSRMATADTEVGLIEEVLGLNLAQLDRLARRANPPSIVDETSVRDHRAAYLQWNLDESELRLAAIMDAVSGQTVQQALVGAADRIPPNPATGLFDPYPVRLVDGLVEVCATTGDETTASPPQVTVHADLDALTTETEGVTELGSGALVPNQVAKYLSCDCVVETVITDGSQVIGVGRSSRTVPGWLRRLVIFRDGTCRFPGCHNTRWVQVHHVHHWARGGTTSLDNLVLLCGFHHRFIHEHDWHVTGDPNNTIIFRRPDWTPFPGPKPQLDPRLRELVRSP